MASFKKRKQKRKNNYQKLICRKHQKSQDYFGGPRGVGRWQFKSSKLKFLASLGSFQLRMKKEYSRCIILHLICTTTAVPSQAVGLSTSNRRDEEGQTTRVATLPARPLFAPCYLSEGSRTPICLGLPQVAIDLKVSSLKYLP